MHGHRTRRSFMQHSLAGGTAAGLADLGFLSKLQPVSASEAAVAPDIVRFSPEVEPLVRLLEETSREQVLEKVAERIAAGTSYREVLAALFLAGVRNVQPRPSVGFKFHAVLVVNSAHLASLSSPDRERWLPIFWAIDNFKSSQARDVREGNWTMSAVDESAVPGPDAARGMFVDAMDNWDVDAADAAVAGLARTAGANELFELFARYGARDFRSIGHKAIFVANSWRTLHCIGWHHAEPVLRSLAYALLNHNGEPKPSESDLAADRPWRVNRELAGQIRDDWTTGKLDEAATRALLKSLHTDSADNVCGQIVEILNKGVSPQSVFDALFLAGGELLMRQAGIVALHALTTTNAMHYNFRMSSNDDTRRMLLLQNAAFLTMFRDALSGRGKVRDSVITDLTPDASAGQGSDALEAVFGDVRGNPDRAASRTLAWLNAGGTPKSFIDVSRRLIFLKGTDSHDYKYSSAVLEDCYNVSPAWRNHFMAASVFKLRGTKHGDNGLIDRAKSALS